MGPWEEPSLAQEGTLNGLKYGISDNKLIAGLLAGFIATHIATITGFWYEIINFPIMDWSRWNGTYLVGYGNQSAVAYGTGIASDFEVFITGYVLHTFAGARFRLLHKPDDAGPVE